METGICVMVTWVKTGQLGCEMITAVTFFRRLDDMLKSKCHRYLKLFMKCRLCRDHSLTQYAIRGDELRLLNTMQSNTKETVRSKLADGTYKLVGKIVNDKTSACWINFQV